MNTHQVYERSVSSGDHSFTAGHDGKYMYCFSNEHWSANSKEVSFNVHGIVYVPESEAPQDPLESESMFSHLPRARSLKGSGSFRVDFADEIMSYAVRQLSELLAQVKDEQAYIVI